MRTNKDKIGQCAERFEVLVGENLCWFKSSWPQTSTAKGIVLMSVEVFLYPKRPHFDSMCTKMCTKGRKKMREDHFVMYKRENGIWCYYVYRFGKKVRRSTGERRKGRAYAIAEERAATGDLLCIIEKEHQEEILYRRILYRRYS